MIFEVLGQILGQIWNGLKFQQLAFRELKRQTMYKSRAEGIAIEPVYSTYTRQRCNHAACGFAHEDNRDGDEFTVRSAAKSYTPTTMQHGISHTDTSRIGAGPGLDGRPITRPRVGNGKRERRVLGFHGIVDRPRVRRQTSAFIPT